MHCITGTYIQEHYAENVIFKDQQERSIWPLKIVMPPYKSRLLYFKTKEDQAFWARSLRKCAENENKIDDFYALKGVLGQGQFGEV